MHLKVFLKLKKTLKTLSSGQIYKKTQKANCFFFTRVFFQPCLEAMIEALERVYLVEGAEGAVPRGPAVEDAARAHVNQRHRAHVTRLPLQVYVIPAAFVAHSNIAINTKNRNRN
jgi:hypothetical protein